MRFLLSLSMIGLTALSSSPASAQDVDELRAVVEAHYTAINSGDVDAAFDHHLPGFSFFHPDGRLLLEPGFPDAVERMGARLEFGEVNVYMTHFDAQIHGNVGIVTFYLVGPRDLEGGRTPDFTTRVTAVWVRDGDGWREAHHHESVLSGSSS